MRDTAWIALTDGRRARLRLNSASNALRYTNFVSGPSILI
jgi:hypothetical protein